MIPASQAVRVIVNESSIALPIAVAGLVLSLVSIASGAVLYWLNGSRIKTELRLTMFGPGNFVSIPLNQTDQIPHMVQQGYSNLSLAVIVRNVGRSSTNVTGFGARLNNGVTISPMSGSGIPNPTLPYSLLSHSEATFHVPMNDVHGVVHTSEATGLAKKDVYDARMEVSFGNGKTRSTKDALPLSK